MIKKAVGIFKDHKQIKNAENYVAGLSPLYEEIWKVLPESKKTLDIGAAYGIMSLACKLRGDDVVAMDMTAKFTNLEMLKKHDIPFVKINLEKDKEIPVQGKADLIIFTEVLEHLNSNPLLTIKKMYNALKPGGYMVCSTPARELFGKPENLNDGNKPGLWNDLTDWRDIPTYKGKWMDQHTFHYSQIDLVSLFAEAGFEVEDITLIAEFSHLIIARKP